MVPSLSTEIQSPSMSSAPESPVESKFGEKEEAGPFEIMRKKNSELISGLKTRNKELSQSRVQLELRLEETRRKLQSVC